MPSPVRALLLLVLIAIPLLEIALLVKTGQWLGFWWTILIVVATAVLGSSLLHRQGIGTIRRVMAAAASGQPPVESLLEGVLLLVAGLLLITPGLITDAVGLLLLVPPLRLMLVRKALSKIFVSGNFSVWETASTGAAEREDPFAHSRSETRGTERDTAADGGIVIEGEFTRIEERTPDPRRGARPDRK